MILFLVTAFTKEMQIAVISGHNAICTGILRFLYQLFRVESIECDAVGDQGDIF